MLDSLAGYNGYFGAAATDGDGQSYYSYDIADSNWHVVNLDTECQLVPGGCAEGSPQETWLGSDLAANSGKNVIAVWHKPRFSSGVTNYTALQDLYDDLYAAGVDLLLQGHDHIYEHAAPMDASANADPTYGIRQFTVGTGGAALQTSFPAILDTSVVRNGTAYGVLKLTLHATTYDWKFLPIAGGTFTDSGSGSVHDAPPVANSAPAAPTLNAPANAATGIGTSPTLDVGVSDPDSDPLTVTYFGRPFASGIFTQLAQHTGIASGTSDTALWASLAAGQKFEWYVTVSDGSLTTTGPTWTFSTSPGTDPVFVGAGDIASCDVTEDTATGNLIDGIQGTVFTTGDNVYDFGTAAEFASCYATTPWGSPSVKARTRPVAGNHDWGTGGPETLADYFAYFGASATDGDGQSYYSYDIAGSNWHVVNLDTECQLVPGGCADGSPQETWLETDLAANSGKNVIAVWHKPRYSSGATDYQALQPLWDALYAAGVDILLDGHDHIYERTAPMKSGAALADPPVADPTYGIRQFTVGTGGEAHHGLGAALPTSVVRNDQTFGILKLTLHATTYDWVFLPIAGSTFTDSGSGSVHAAPPGASTVPGAPTIGTATPGNAQATVTWSAPASNGGSSITGYVVTPYIGATAQTATTVGTVLTTTITGLTNGTTYTFRVAAINSVGTGSQSANSNAVTPATVPGAPTIGTATPGNAQATVTWSAPASNGGSSITGYVVTPYIGATAQTATTVGTVLTTTITGLTNGTTYTFRVAAINGVGTGSQSANSNAVTPTSVAFRSSSFGQTGGTTSLTIAKPAGVLPGDILIAAISVLGLPTIAAPSDWIVIQANTNGSGLKQITYFHVVTGSEGAAFSWTFASSSATGGIAAYSGVDVTAPPRPVDASGGQPTTGSTTNVVAPSIDTNVDWRPVDRGIWERDQCHILPASRNGRARRGLVNKGQEQGGDGADRSVPRFSRPNRHANRRDRQGGPRHWPAHRPSAGWVAGSGHSA